MNENVKFAEDTGTYKTLCTIKQGALATIYLSRFSYIPLGIVARDLEADQIINYSPGDNTDDIITKIGRLYSKQHPVKIGRDRDDEIYNAA